MNRINVVGITCAGKTTVARRLSQTLGLPHVELDALHWEPNWTMAQDEVFRGRVEEAITGDRWVADGNYWTKLGDMLWRRADAVVWLDLPFPLVLWRVLSRTIRRGLRKTELWSGNVEKLSNLFRKDGLLVWAFKMRKRNRARYVQAMKDPRFAHLEIVRLRSPRAVDRFLENVQAKGGDRV